MNPHFLLIKQLFKTSCLTAKRGKSQLSYLYRYDGKTNDFVLTSFKAATRIFPPSVIDLYKCFTQNMYFILKCAYESTKNNNPILHPSY